MEIFRLSFLEGLSTNPYISGHIIPYNSCLFYLCVHIRKPGCKFMCVYCPGRWCSSFLYIFLSSPLQPQCCCMKTMNNSSLGILPLPLKSVAAATVCPLLCLSAHQYLGSSQADPCSMWQKRSVLTQETEDGKTRWCSIFFCFPCDPEPDTLLVCSSAPVVLLQEEFGVYLNSTPGFVKLSFSLCDIAKFHFIHSLQTPLPWQSF